MADNVTHISAGIVCSKDESVDPSAGENTAYVSAGLPPEVITGGTSASTWLWARQHQSQIVGGGVS